MTQLNREQQLLIEQYADGQLAERDRARVERLLSENPAAAEYREALAELHQIVRMPVELACDAMDFDALLGRVMGAVDAAAESRAAKPVASAREPELEMMAMAMADGQLGADKRGRVEAYLERTPEARDGVQAVRELGDALRQTIERESDRVNFDALAMRIDQAIDAVAAEAKVSAPAAAAPAPGLWARLVSLVDAHRAAFASVATAMIITVAIGSVTLFQDPASPGQTVIHNYYYPVIEGVQGQPGFTASSIPGDARTEVAPVVWFAPDPASPQPTVPAGSGHDGQPL